MIPFRFLQHIRETFRFSSKGGVGGGLLFLLLNSCNPHPDQVTIKGDFQHLEQGEFYIYSPSGAIDRLDTLKIQEGEFLYTARIDGEAIFRIMYPNYTELTVFARPGDELEVSGDAQNLNGVDVEGSDDNEVYNAFRKDITDLPAAKQLELARQYILRYPHLAVSRYLFSTYILQADSLPRQQVTEVYDSLCRANPDNLELSKLSRQVKSYALLREGAPLPAFSLQTRTSAFEGGQSGRTVTAKDFRGDYLLMVFWASWKSGSQSVLYRTRRFRREMKAKGITVNAISYCLDAAPLSLPRIERDDSVDYHSFCDYQSFNSPLVQQWGIRDIPYFVLVSPQQKIIAHGSDWFRDIEPKVNKICL